MLDGADGNRVSRRRAARQPGRGIDVLNGSDGNAFERVSSTGNRTGIAVTARRDNAIRLGTFSGNAIDGSALFGASRQPGDANRVADNGCKGAVVEGSEDNQVTRTRRGRGRRA